MLPACKRLWGGFGVALGWLSQPFCIHPSSFCLPPMPWYYRTPSNPRFRSATLIQLGLSAPRRLHSARAEGVLPAAAQCSPVRTPHRGSSLSSAESGWQPPRLTSLSPSHQHPTSVGYGSSQGNPNRLSGFPGRRLGQARWRKPLKRLEDAPARIPPTEVGC